MCSSDLFRPAMNGQGDRQGLAPRVLERLHIVELDHARLLLQKVSRAEPLLGFFAQEHELTGHGLAIERGIARKRSHASEVREPLSELLVKAAFLGTKPAFSGRIGAALTTAMAPVALDPARVVITEIVTIEYNLCTA